MTFRAIVLACVLALAAGAPLAHEGEDHGEKKGLPSTAAPMTGDAPRFAATSDAFELVGVVEGRRVTLWLDRFADNTPVTGATIDLEIGDARVTAKAAGEVYVAELALPPAGANVAVTATITAGKETDLLAADFAMPAATGAATAAAPRTSPFPGTWVALAGVAIALVAGVVGWVLGRRGRAQEVA